MSFYVDANIVVYLAWPLQSINGRGSPIGIVRYDLVVAQLKLPRHQAVPDSPMTLKLSSYTWSFAYVNLFCFGVALRVSRCFSILY